MEEMSTLCCTYSIIMCAKPHSADVEIIIFANNFLKFQINLKCLGYMNEIIDNTIERMVKHNCIVKQSI